MSHVHVVCPEGVVTGGPELLHQLVDSLTRQGQPASILYYPFGKSHSVPEPYRRYQVSVGKITDVRQGDRVVIPEVMPYLVGRFPGASVYFWWLSVDNYFAALAAGRIGKAIPRRVREPVQLSVLRRRVHAHLYQSEYARLFLADKGMKPRYRLSDFLASEYIDGVAVASPDSRLDVVAFNPAKGAEQTAAIEAALRAKVGEAVRFVPIQNMSRAQVRELLLSAKVYIDFGNHPGKDRIPREAAALGACLLVNRRGSAGNSVDIGVPDEYRVDDCQINFAETAAERIMEILNHFPLHFERLTPYRQQILTEPAVFEADVRATFLAQ